MKASELRIGNYVKDPYNKEIRLVSVDKDASMLSPIPLTEEWLLKLGALKDLMTSGLFKIRLKEYTLEIMMNGFSGTLIKEPSWWITIKGYNDKVTFTKMYVHQLQNLYHALTGEELKIR